MISFPLIVISGATATGKTSLSIEIAKSLIDKKYQAEVINFDSLLFFRELNIGTAKPTQEEQSGIPHHLMDICSVQDEMNANRFCQKAIDIIHELHDKAVIPIIVGGSAFYIRALIKGMYEGTTISEQTKIDVQKILEEKGFSYIRDQLKEKDHQSYIDLHENDEYRNIRAFEYLLQTASPISEQKNKIDDPYDFSKNQFPDWNIHHIYLELPKEEHWPLMKLRTEKMITDGLIDEVKTILEQGITENEKPLQSIGYKETIEYIRNSSNDIPALIEKIYIATRQLAKSQKTFFKKIKPKYNYHPLKDRDRILQEAISFIEKTNKE